jgi:Leucine-rich repeat (LRR) protein
MKWYLEDLKKWISNGCDNDTALQIIKLDLTFNELTTIPNEIFKLINLQVLFLQNNKITTIPAGLRVKTNSFNLLPNEIGKLINLKKLFLGFNTLTTIPAEIGNLVNLKALNLCENKLTILPNEIGNLINLEELYIECNDLITIPITITNIREVFIFIGNNPIEYIPPQVMRHIERPFRIFKKQKIYNDNQSVHNHTIQEGIKKSINYIMSIKPIYNLDNLNEIIINNKFINDNTKTILFEYINCQDIHSILNITFSELLVNILSFIEQHISKEEIYKILEQEMNDTICKCFTGRMSRLINCLNGFDDNIVINISNNEQIANIIILTKDKLILENNYTETLHKEIVIKELYDRGFDEGNINKWIEYI